MVIAYLVFCIVAACHNNAFAQAAGEGAAPEPQATQSADSEGSGGGNDAPSALPSANDSASAGEIVPREIVVKVEGWNRALDSLVQASEREGIGDEQLAKMSSEASDIRNEASILMAEQAPLVTRISEQLDELGPAPAEGEPAESTELANRRAQLNARLSSVDGIQTETRLVMLRASQVERSTLAIKRERFVQRLFVRSYGIFDPELWTRSTLGGNRYLKSLWLQITESFSYAAGRIASEPLKQAWSLAQLFFVFAVYFLVRRWLGAEERRALPPPSPKGLEGQISAAAQIRWLISNGVLPGILFLFVYEVFQKSGLFPARFVALLESLLIELATAVLAIAILTLVVRPRDRTKRMAPISDAAARDVRQAGIVTVAIILFLTSVNFSAVQLFAPVETSIAISAFAIVAFLAGVAFIMWRVAFDLRQQEEAPPGVPVIRWRIVNPVIWIAWAISLGGLLTGYTALSEFFAYQLLFGLMIAVTLWLFLRLIDQTKAKVFSEQGGQFRFSGIQQGTSKQLTILLFGLARLVVVITAIFAFLLPWGIRSQDWISLFRRGFFGFQVGNLTISLSSIILAGIIFVIGMIATRQITNWLGKQYLPTTRLDVGMRNSITTILGYVGIVITSLLAITAAGLNLSNVAIVAGALSVGIGFGLQSIVNNFVSGLILLAERPIKTGDWVVTSGGQGRVGRISVRSTEIQTFDGATVILPNSTMITEAVTNWTHRNTKGRIIVAIGVGYDSDPVMVRELLVECARAHPLVLDDPEPQAYFLDFGADALMFDVRAYLADVGNTLSVSSDLRFAILQALRDANIEIPYPQRDLHIKSGPFAGFEAKQTNEDSGMKEHKDTVDTRHNEIED
ncbi:MAG: mechanosensitive ion channel family protein [Rhizobiaceae bacterium]